MYHCPSCRSFVSLAPFIQMRSDYVFCRCCGTSFYVPSYYCPALVSETRRAETLAAQVEDFQNGPKGNALSPVYSSVLQPNGKIKKVRLQPPSNQLELFGGVL